MATKFDLKNYSVTKSYPTATPWTATHQASLSPSPRTCPSSCPLPWWCHPAISSSVTLFCYAFDLSQHQGLFQWVGSSHQVAKVLELQLQHQFFQWVFRVDFLKDWLVWSPCCPRDSQETYPTPQFENMNSLVLSLLYGPTLTSHGSWYCTGITGKTIALRIWTLVTKTMSLLFNMLFRFVTAFCPSVF